jgi:glutamate-ammonia-ligase adenylyltransferase
VAGDIHLGQAFEALRQEILSKPRDLLHLKQEIHQMRLKMRSHHKSSPDVFDLKHGVGGLIDFEFCVQYWVLGFSGRFPELLGNWGNLALAQKAAELGLVGENQAQGIALVKEAGEAYRVLRAKQHQLRLAEQNQEVIPGIALLEERRAIERLYLFTFG